jgi:RimJ/RimL family protein N-acetyltransferase
MRSAHWHRTSTIMGRHRCPGGEPERRTIAFRVYLRDHPQVAREYEQLKRDLVRRYDAGELESPDGYAAAKTSLVTRLAIVQRDTDRLIGACDLTLEGNSEGDLGYILRRDAWGRGYATEAARAMVDAGFAQLRLDSIIATCEVGQPASACVLEKAGLRWVRTLEHHREAQGRWWDLELFRVARTEWT